MGKIMRNLLGGGLEWGLEEMPKQKSGYSIDIEQVRTNAKLMKEKGLEGEILNIAERELNKASSIPANGFGSGRGSSFITKESIAEILGLFGGSVEGINVLYLGCGNGYSGDGNYMPILSTALASLGAKVIGVDASHMSEEEKDKMYEKFGFRYERLDIAQPYMFDYKNKEIFENKDLVFARSLLYHGLKCPTAGPLVTFDPLEEWQIYCSIVHKAQELNTKEAIYNLEIPLSYNFKFPMEKIDEKDIPDEERQKEKNDYLINEFKSNFGEIIFGEENPGYHVFTT